MKTWQIILMLPLLAIAIGGGRASAQANGISACIESAGGHDRDEFQLFDRELRAAALRNDPALFVMLAENPLRINDDTGSISILDAATLHKRFDSIFTKGIRAAIVNTKLDDLICRQSGIGYGNGDLWVRVLERGGMEGYAISSINLPSTRPLTSTGVRFVCRAKDQRILIDTAADRKLRFRSWNRPRSLTDRPDLELTSGTEEIEGTGLCSHTVWSFQKGDLRSTVSELGCTGDAEPRPPVGARGHFSFKGAGGTQESGGWCY